MSELPVDEVAGAGTGPLSRRDRARADTAREIKQTARRVLVEHGPDGLALRAVAREMGMTAPALYRYFANREDLVEHVVADLYGELCQELEVARDAAEPATPGVQLMECARAFRARATTHHLEFGLLFGSAAEALGADAAKRHEGPAHEAGERFGAIFAVLVAQLYLDRGFPVPADDEIEPALQDQLQAWCDHFPVRLPLGVMHVFLSCWIRLYGMVCMEVFGHLRFALDDAQPMFESELRELGRVLGVQDQYRPPSA
jgi:AcrR family transcriptional regulator